MKKLLSIIIFFFISYEVCAHQPKLNDGDFAMTSENPYIIKDPEISKAIYTTLNGKPHIYKISSDKSFKFYVGLTVPKIDECKDFKKYSFEILDSNRKVIKKFDGESFMWWSWYEKYGKQWYWVGPEYGENFKSNAIFEKGEYFIKVYSKDNFGNYVLATGDIEKFGLKVLAKMPFTLPKINKKFWGSGCGN